MFGIGFGEIIVLAAIGILVLGPERCVTVAKSLGKMWGKLQREWRDVKADISVTDDIEKTKKDMEDMTKDERS